MKFCSNCGQMIVPNAAFCQACGAELQPLANNDDSQQSADSQQSTEQEVSADEEEPVQADDGQSPPEQQQQQGHDRQPPPPPNYQQQQPPHGQQPNYAPPGQHLHRSEIKERAKLAMKPQWGVAVLLFLVYIGIVFVGSSLAWFPILGAMVVAGTLWFVDLPLSVSLYGSYLNIYSNIPTRVGDMFRFFSHNYLRKVGGMAWMMLFTMLWSLLFAIPGIVKGIAYSMTPFILAHHPNVSATDALKLSMRMTKGYKGELFVFILSYIGWYMLSALTFGILAVVYVGPYFGIASAGYFAELRNRALTSGTIHPSELDPPPANVYQQQPPYQQ